MDGSTGWSAAHPIVLGAGAVMLLLDLYLLVRLWQHWRLYRQTPGWPRLELAPERVDLVRVVHSREGQPTHTTQHHEAVLLFRYRVDGRNFERRLVRPLADPAATEALKTDTRLGFIYDPRRPDRTLDAPTGLAPVLRQLLVLLLVNGIGLSLLAQLAGFFHG